MCLVQNGLVEHLKQKFLRSPIRGMEPEAFFDVMPHDPRQLRIKGVELAALEPTGSRKPVHGGHGFAIS